MHTHTSTPVSPALPAHLCPPPPFPLGDMAVMSSEVAALVSLLGWFCLGLRLPDAIGSLTFPPPCRHGGKTNSSQPSPSLHPLSVFHLLLLPLSLQPLSSLSPHPFLFTSSAHPSLLPPSHNGRPSLSPLLHSPPFPFILCLPDRKSVV